MESGLDGDLKKGGLPAAFCRSRDIQRFACGNPFLSVVELSRSAERNEFFCLLSACPLATVSFMNVAPVGGRWEYVNR
jgi:hypothetical protein